MVFFIHIPSQSNSRCCSYSFPFPSTFQVELPFPFMKIPVAYLIIRNLNSRRNQVRYVQTRHYTSSSLNTHCDGLKTQFTAVFVVLAMTQHMTELLCCAGILPKFSIHVPCRSRVAIPSPVSVSEIRHVHSRSRGIPKTLFCSPAAVHLYGNTNRARRRTPKLTIIVGLTIVSYRCIHTKQNRILELLCCETALNK